MGWNNWPYWFRGGLLSVGIIILITLILIPFGEMNTGGQMSATYYSIPFIPGFLIVFALRVNSPPIAYFLAFVFPLLLYFAIGAFIGWIVGKIKHRNAQ